MIKDARESLDRNGIAPCCQSQWCTRPNTHLGECRDY
jgi:hypothetical protein